MGVSAETEESGQVRREWDDIFNMLKEKKRHQEYFIQKSCPSETKERLRTFLAQMQAEGLNHYIFPTRNAERGSSS